MMFPENGLKAYTMSICIVKQRVEHFTCPFFSIVCVILCMTLIPVAWNRSDCVFVTITCNELKILQLFGILLSLSLSCFRFLLTLSWSLFLFLPLPLTLYRGSVKHFIIYSLKVLSQLCKVHTMCNDIKMLVENWKMNQIQQVFL